MTKIYRFTQPEIDFYEKRYKQVRESARLIDRDVSLLDRAFSYAAEKHSRQRRDSGEPYINHLISVAEKLVEMRRGSETIAAGLLHDVLEDTDATENELLSLFGSMITDLVKAVTQVNFQNGEISKEDQDYLSDINLINEVKTYPDALYVKIADRLHNLSTLESVNYTKRVLKANNTRSILLQLTKDAGAYRYAALLEDACLFAEKPDIYKIIEEQYKKLLKADKYQIDGLHKYLHRFYEGKTRISRKIVSVEFKERSVSSIHFDLTSRFNRDSIYRHIDKKAVPLKDIFFITGNDCAEMPSSIFLSIYKNIQNGVYKPPRQEKMELLQKPIQYKLTIISQDIDELTGAYFFLIEDSFSIRYRLFAEKQEWYETYTDGNEEFLTGRKKRRKKYNPMDFSASFQKTITVFKKNGEPMQIEEGATVLDAAFAIHPSLAFGMRYALLNGEENRMPLYTKLSQGDTFEIVSDTQRNSGCYKDHSTVHWIEYCYTRSALKSLSRHLEIKLIDSKPVTMATDLNSNEEYELEIGSTVLDLVFAIDPSKAFMCREIFVNSSQTGSEFRRPIGYGDRVRIVYDEADTVSEDWRNYVKTETAKKAIEEYFNRKS